MLATLGRKVGIEKPINPHNFATAEQQLLEQQD